MFIAGNRMIDCAKGLAELSPYEGYRCFVEGLDWSIFAHHAERTWSAVTTSALAQRAAIVGTVVVVWPAIILSWLLSFSFIAGLYELAKSMPASSPTTALFASWNQTPTVLHRQAQFIKTSSALFMLLGGAILGMAGVSYHEAGFKLLQGGWEIVCGAALYFLPISWWSSTYLVTGAVHPVWRAVGDIVSALGDLLEFLIF